MIFDQIDTTTELLPVARVGMQPAITRAAGVRVTHKPTGVVVTVPSNGIRSQHKLRQMAMEAVEYIVTGL
jgi:protein subunit release factor A